MAAALGVTFRWGVAIDRLVERAGRITGVMTSEGLLTADGFVLAWGRIRPRLAAPFGMRLPVYPVKGYSITADRHRCGPRAGLDRDGRNLQGGDHPAGRPHPRGRPGRNRGFDLSLNPRRRATLEKSVGELFGGGGDLAGASFWTGLRPMTPDGTPIVGASTVSNLWLNTGHGTLGWTMAAGSGRLLADLISRAARPRSTPPIWAMPAISANRAGRRPRAGCGLRRPDRACLPDGQTPAKSSTPGAVPGVFS
jgi:D-amino-acid dehydrogenase